MAGRALVEIAAGLALAAGPASGSPASEPSRKAWSVAAGSLRANYRRLDGTPPRTLIVSGPRVYQHVHARDFSYAAGGALALGDLEPVRDTLETFIGFQRADGLYPRALATWPPYLCIALEYLGFKVPFRPPIRPNYVSEAFVENIDPNALLAWTAARYVAASGDSDFGRRHHRSLSAGLAWYEGRLDRGLVSQPPYSDWQDTISRRGRVFYSNLAYWRGLESMADLAALLGRNREAERWRRRGRELQARAKAFFWDEQGGFFRGSEEWPGLEAGANLLAIAWGFAGKTEADRILQAFEKAGVWRKLGPRATVPDYPLRAKSYPALLSGFGDYHDRQVWSWQTAAAGLAFARLGDRRRGLEVLGPMAEVAARDGELGEVYDDAGQVRRWLARSESPFAWGSGLWVEALSALGDRRR